MDRNNNVSVLYLEVSTEEDKSLVIKEESFRDSQVQSDKSAINKDIIDEKI